MPKIKTSLKFPNPQKANEDGIVAIGGKVEIEHLIEAYQNGIFPWPISDQYPLCWFSPEWRGVLIFDELKIPKSFQKKIKKFDQQFKITFNQAFEQVIEACQKVPRKSQNSTWITEEIKKGYIDFHRQGHAYSIEAWKNGELKAGLYGVSLGNFFSGESMFHLETDLSKYCLYKLILKLKENNIQWLDTQMVTPVVESFGGKNIERNDFLKMLSTLDFTQSRKQYFD